MTTNPQNIGMPPPGGAIVGAGGVATGPFFQFLQTLWLRTGGNIGGSTTVDATARAEAATAQTTANAAETAAAAAQTTGTAAQLLGLLGQAEAQSAQATALRAGVPPAGQAVLGQSLALSAQGAAEAARKQAVAAVGLGFLFGRF